MEETMETKVETTELVPVETDDSYDEVEETSSGSGAAYAALGALAVVAGIGAVKLFRKGWTKAKTWYKNKKADAEAAPVEAEATEVPVEKKADKK